MEEPGICQVCASTLRAYYKSMLDVHFCEFHNKLYDTYVKYNSVYSHTSAFPRHIKEIIIYYFDAIYSEPTEIFHTQRFSLLRGLCNMAFILGYVNTYMVPTFESSKRNYAEILYFTVKQFIPKYNYFENRKLLSARDTPLTYNETVNIRSSNRELLLDKYNFADNIEHVMPKSHYNYKILASMALVDIAYFFDPFNLLYMSGYINCIRGKYEYGTKLSSERIRCSFYNCCNNGTCGHPDCQKRLPNLRKVMKSIEEINGNTETLIDAETIAAINSMKNIFNIYEIKTTFGSNYIFEPEDPIAKFLVGAMLLHTTIVYGNQLTESKDKERIRCAYNYISDTSVLQPEQKNKIVDFIKNIDAFGANYDLYLPGEIQKLFTGANHAHIQLGQVDTSKFARTNLAECFFYAFRKLLEHDFDSEIKEQIFRQFSKYLLSTQQMDIPIDTSIPNIIQKIFNSPLLGLTEHLSMSYFSTIEHFIYDALTQTDTGIVSTTQWDTDSPPFEPSQNKSPINMPTIQLPSVNALHKTGGDSVDHLKYLKYKAKYLISKNQPK